MARRARLAAAVWLTLVGVQPVGAQPVGPPAPIVRDNRCRPAEAGPDEVVVCGRSDENSPYRIPRELRERPQVEDRHVSWDTRFRDAQALERFSSQNVGHSGLSQHSRQVDCQWRTARQEMRGERPDCGRGGRLR